MSLRTKAANAATSVSTAVCQQVTHHLQSWFQEPNSLIFLTNQWTILYMMGKCTSGEKNKRTLDVAHVKNFRTKTKWLRKESSNELQRPAFLPGMELLRSVWSHNGCYVTCNSRSEIISRNSVIINWCCWRTSEGSPVTLLKRSSHHMPRDISWCNGLFQCSCQKNLCKKRLQKTIFSIFVTLHDMF